MALDVEEEVLTPFWMLDHTVRKDLETTPRKHTDLYLEQPLVATCDYEESDMFEEEEKTSFVCTSFFLFLSKVSLLSPFEVQTSLCTFLVDRFNNDL